MLKILMFSVLLFISSYKNKWAETACLTVTGAVLTMMIWVNKTSVTNSIYGLGLDVISVTLIMLSFWITALMITASTSVARYNFKPKWFLINIMILMLFLNLTFSSTNVLMFYISFEATLIPTLLLILGWGYQPERTQAGIYLLFYTLAASLPLLLMIFYMKYSEGSVSMYFLNNNNVDMGNLGYVATIMAFLVKMPMFVVHLWLPKAHVEAPVSGSMILAGVLLKLGGYGLIRMGPLYYNNFMNFNLIWVTVSLMGGVMTSFICLRQTDTKSLVAYSSVAHMSLVISGVMAGSVTGGVGSLILMVAHGLCSSGMFCLTNMLYERVHSRNMIICKGFMLSMPSMALWWFLLSACNMAAPPSINLLGEIILINSISAYDLLNTLMVGTMSFMSAAFTLYLFAYTQHGRPFNGLFSFSTGKMNEYTTLMLHWLPLNLIIMKSEVFVF